MLYDQDDGKQTKEIKKAFYSLACVLFSRCKYNYQHDYGLFISDNFTGHSQEVLNLAGN